MAAVAAVALTLGFFALVGQDIFDTFDPPPPIPQPIPFGDPGRVAPASSQRPEYDQGGILVGARGQPGPAFGAPPVESAEPHEATKPAEPPDRAVAAKPTRPTAPKTTKAEPPLMIAERTPPTPPDHVPDPKPTKGSGDPLDDRSGAEDPYGTDDWDDARGGGKETKRTAPPGRPPAPAAPAAPAALQPKAAAAEPPVQGNTGKVTLRVQPNGLRVFFKGKELGKTPLFNAVLPAGKQELRLVDAAGREKKLTVVVKAGETISVRSSWDALPR